MNFGVAPMTILLHALGLLFFATLLLVALAGLRGILPASAATSTRARTGAGHSLVAIRAAHP
ncbi:MAG: hypothetical protein D6807_03195 [Alphaproteobacteria bacterium]|nr:MAG: hypothetical protein D6807_03195 [Alphaproteobacteria bacterium]